MKKIYKVFEVDDFAFKGIHSPVKLYDRTYLSQNKEGFDTIKDAEKFVADFIKFNPNHQFVILPIYKNK